MNSLALSKDVVSDLGLIVIDEEQRFGVKHKETLKELKKGGCAYLDSCHPYTSNSSYVYARNLRFVSHRNTSDQSVSCANFCIRDQSNHYSRRCAEGMDRGGQVYYLYNKVDTIEQKVSELKELIPEASIGFVHGQMSEVRLENTLLDFINGEYDVLVTTTIIETGVIFQMLLHSLLKMRIIWDFQLFIN